MSRTRSVHGATVVLCAVLTLALPKAMAADQGGARAVAFEGALTLDALTVALGGVEQRSGWLANLDLVGTLDGEAFGWSGGSATLYVLGNTGATPSAWVGDLQVTNNIEAPEALRVFEAFVEQKLFDGRLQLLAGLRDLNADFYVMENGGMFLNSSHGIGVEFSQTGQNGPSIFPNSALTVRVAAALRDGMGIRLAVFDAVANDPERPQDTRLRLAHDEGALLSGELEFFRPEDPSLWRTTLGGWSYTRSVAPRERADRTEVDPATVVDRGVYGVVEGRLAAWGDDTRLDGFARLGFANGDAHAISRGWGGGVVATGLFGRTQDALGVALAVASGSDEFDTAFTETLIEATYDLVVTAHLQFRWDAQWVDQVDLPGSPDDALKLTLRTTLVF